ncbi:MAG: MFS transporter [Chloroflexi bacterium]|nr:MFS transporter [Chloroflexota bacterium]
MDTTTSVAASTRKARFYYGWAIVVVMGLVGFTQSAETFPVLGVFMKPINAEFGWSRTVFTGSITLGTLLGGMLALVIGPIIDRFGSRWTLTIAFALLGASLVLTAFVTSLWQFYALQAIGRMLNMGVIALASSVVIPKWFVAQRGRAVALSGLGIRVGNAVTPLYVQFMVSAGNWRVAIAMTGILTWVVSMIPAAIFLRRRPEDMGLLPDGAQPGKTVEANARGEKGNNLRGKGEVSLTLKQVMRQPSFYLLVAGFSLVFIAAPATNLHMIPFMTDRGISDGVAVAAVAIFSVFAGIGSLVFGYAAERFPTRIVTALLLLLMATGYAGILLVHTGWHGIIWASYYGLVSGGMFTLQQVLMADYFGRDSLGAVRGVVWPVQMVFNAFGPFAASVAYDMTGSYVATFTIFAVIVTVATVLVFIARPPVLKTAAEQVA